MPHIGLAAGEISGDILGQGLINALSQTKPNLASSLQITGIAGPRMQQAGCHATYSIDHLSVMGISEVFRALPRIYFGVYRGIIRHFIEHRPDIFIGIDSPDFNLRVAGHLKKQGITTVQYVSPTLWAWRESRIKTIKKNIDQVLVILPFEQDFYARHDISARYVGHPLADQLPLNVEDCQPYQKKLGLPQNREYIALLPGSRMSEIKALLEDFLAAAHLCLKKRPTLSFLIPAANPKIAQCIRQHLESSHEHLPVQVFDGQAHDVIRASQAVLTASGTATLEIMLLKRPMVMAYRLAGLTHWIAKRLVTARYFSLPNLLANDALIPEFIQDDVSPNNLAGALLHSLNQQPHREALINRFTSLHKTLRQDTNATAAKEVWRLI